MIKCDKCGKTFDSERSLRSHKRFCNLETKNKETCNTKEDDVTTQDSDDEIPERHPPTKSQKESGWEFKEKFEELEDVFVIKFVLSIVDLIHHLFVF